MKNFSITVNKVEDGIMHVKSAGLMMKEAAQYASAVKVEKDGHMINAKDILEWLGLRVSVGDELSVKIEGPDEDAALGGLQKYFNNQFA